LPVLGNFSESSIPKNKSLGPWVLLLVLLTTAEPISGLLPVSSKAAARIRKLNLCSIYYAIASAEGDTDTGTVTTTTLQFAQLIETKVRK
jgi:hypothetical protein